jgi:hypothetical protein
VAQQLRWEEKLQDFREPYDGVSRAGEQTEYLSHILATAWL